MKNIALFIIVLGLCAHAFAQNPIQNKMTFYTIGQDGKETILCEDESVEDAYIIDFHGKPTNIKTNGSDGKEETIREENADLYVYFPEFTDYDNPLSVCLAVNSNIPYTEAGFIISRKPVEELNGDVTDFVYIYPPKELFSVYGKQVMGTVTDATQRGFSLSDSVKDVSSQLKVMGANPNDILAGDTTYYAKLNIGIPAYCTDYYIRPYAILNNGEIMLGGQKVFTSTKTIMGYLANSERVGKVHSVINNIVITQNAIEIFCQQYSQYLGNAHKSNLQMSAIARDLSQYIQKDYSTLFLLKQNITGTEPCTDGTLSLVDELPAGVASDYWVSVCNGISIDLIYDLNKDTDNGGSMLYTKQLALHNSQNYYPIKIEYTDTHQVIETEYVEYQPLSPSTNPYVAFNIPRFMMPTDYDMYITFINLPQDPRPVRFNAYIWEAQLENEIKSGEFPPTGFKLTNPNTTETTKSIYVGNGDNVIDTIYLGRYTFKGANRNMLQINTQVTSKLQSTYTRTMRIAEIKFVPVLSDIQK